MAVTLKDIGEKAGVTKATVSYALRNDKRISLKTRERVQKIAQDLGYQSNPMLASLSSLRRKSTHSHHGNLACIIGHPDSNPIKRVQSYSLIYKGLKERAEELNFSIDSFWAYDPDLQGELLDKTLKSRSICGIALLGINETELELDWEQYSVAYATSARKAANCSFSNIHTNLGGILTLALEKIVALGYRRIGLCVGEENLIGSHGLFHGCLAYARQSTKAQHPPDIPVFSRSYASTASQQQHDQKRFREWYDRYEPEIIILENYTDFLGSRFSPCLGTLNLQQKIVSLDLRVKEHPQFAGIQINHSTRGRMAMDLITEQVFSNNFGPPQNPKCVIMSNFSWVPGKLQSITRHNRNNK